MTPFYHQRQNRHLATGRLDRVALKRAASCVNALAGVRNPAAVREVIEAARMGLRAWIEQLTDDEVEEEWPEFGRMIDALAALDQEPGQ